jgi:ethanolamine ammonia-lyase small subunit
MVMNSPDLPYSRSVKDSVSREAWNEMDPDTCARVCHKGRGIRDFILDLLEFVQAKNITVMTLAEVYEEIKDSIHEGV